MRGKPEKFAEHYLQAKLFFDSQPDVEKAHIIGGFRLELGKLTVPAIRERVVSSLRNASDELARAVASGVGISLPVAMPRILGSLEDGSAAAEAFIAAIGKHRHLGRDSDPPRI